MGMTYEPIVVITPFVPVTHLVQNTINDPNHIANGEPPQTWLIHVGSFMVTSMV
jgi:hypothetical protein